MTSGTASGTASATASGTVESRWVRRHPSRSATGRRFVCFPPAGAGAGFYRDWAAHLPADCEVWAVRYPGREDRFGEPLLPDLEVMADRVAAVPDLLDGTPLWLFGHSMGALLAYEVARRTEPSGMLERLVVSGRVGRRHHRAGLLHRLDDEAFAAEFRTLGGVPDELLDDPEMRAVLLPIMRSDYRAVETYRIAPHPPLRVPVLALAGADDRHAPPGLVGDWAEATRGPFRLGVHPGGHFFLVPGLREVLRDVLAPV
ncbi:thioesterase [Kineosporia sp. J2-2]|uniref:Thioesterase n=1 Tax=Kineosporia corallincola TaxID=2835133 RepID=A0ABS5TG62_9ACTN|nr:alpha/beta fold hydrolase [Kineosporia corallincola]MBT0770086.1 thioesterase [Kineosporia corallincola]